MENFKLLNCAHLRNCLISQVIIFDLEIIKDILLVEFTLNIYLDQSLAWELFVGVKVHTESILTWFISVVETDIDVGDVSNLVLRQNTKDSLFKEFLDFTMLVLELLLVALDRLRCE